MIVLMRHAQTKGGHGRCVGRTRLPLSEEGRKQAMLVADLLSQVGSFRLCSSPSRRSLDTIAPLAEKWSQSVDVFPGLDEIDMGSWDGLAFDAIQQMYPEQYEERGKRFASFCAPGGESFSQVADRAFSVLEELAAGPLPVLVMTHAGVIRALVCRLTGHSMDDLFHFKSDNMHCYAFTPTDKGLRPTAMNVPLEGLIGI